MSQTSGVDCPICGCSFAASYVNEHVNKCLNSQSKNNASQANGGSILDERDVSGNSFIKGNDNSPIGSTAKRTATNRKASGSWFNNSSPQTNALKRSSSNLAGKPSTNPPVKKLKSHESTNSSKSSDSHESQNSVLFTPATKQPVSFQNSNSYFLGQKKSTENSKGQKSKSSQFTPLAERMRPKTFAEYVGQSQVLGSNSLLRNLLEADEIPSMIFWGPPGCGKVFY